VPLNTKQTNKQSPLNVAAVHSVKEASFLTLEPCYYLLDEAG